MADKNRIYVHESFGNNITQTQELSVCYSVKGFLECLKKTQVGESFYQSLGQGREMRIYKLWPQETSDRKLDEENPLNKSASYKSWIFGGNGQANKQRELYAEYTIKSHFITKEKHMRIYDRYGSHIWWCTVIFR